LLNKVATNKAIELSKSKFHYFSSGLFEVVPREVFESGISTNDLHDILVGPQNVDVADMFRNWELEGYNDSDNQIVWLKNILRRWSQENLRIFIQFVTGSSQVPSDGFGGYRRKDAFTIKRVPGPPTAYPVAHNCFNRIDFPRYTSEPQMEEMLNLAMNNSDEMHRA
jgi:hypothetical protein